MSCGMVMAQGKVKYSKKDLGMLKAYYFNEGFNKPATKKISTVITKDGAEHKGFCTDVDTKKGQIYEIELKNEATGDKETFEAGNVAEAYLYASGFEKWGKMASKISNFGLGRKSGKKLTASDEIYFVNKKVSLKNKKDDKEFLMQLINPEFSSIIAVYHDPNAKESGGFSVGGSPNFGGGIEKSYYVEKGDDIFWLRKSDFDDYYETLFGDNPQFMKKYPYKSISWDWLSALVLEYTKMSKT